VGASLVATAGYPIVLGNGPLTDLRSLAISALFHGLVILLASLPALDVALPAAKSRAKALYAELDPVDNRADVSSTPGDGGGIPGEIGEIGTMPIVDPTSGTKSGGAAHDSIAGSILGEILPERRPRPIDESQRALPGPRTIGTGLMPGTGSGGNDGEGGGSGGAGRGVGPGTQFFGARERGHSFAYVIDCSGSMATRDSLEVAKREMLASISQLPPDAVFAVILYNLQARMLADPQGQRGLMAATAATKERIQSQLATIQPDGGTDHMLALRTALTLKPEVIFFLTDADLMSNGDVNQILTEVGKTRIQAVEFGRGTQLGEQSALARLAHTTGGSYLYIDVSQFPRSNTGF
jgi:von Willebrand factor type A domain